jgi:hypothetical protein
MDSAELLAQLADIHLPPPVSFWPPAPGWWVLAFVVLALLIWLVAKWLEAARQRKICAYALQELDDVYNVYLERAAGGATQADEARLLFVNQVNAVLRRVALWHYPGSGIASLGGTQWVDFIRKKGESSPMSDEIAEAISRGRFQTRCEVDPEQLYRFAERWIANLYVHNSRAGKPSRPSARVATHA